MPQHAATARCAMVLLCAFAADTPLFFFLIDAAIEMRVYLRAEPRRLRF